MDRLFLVRLKSGKEAHLLIHIEIQTQFDPQAQLRAQQARRDQRERLELDFKKALLKILRERHPGEDYGDLLRLIDMILVLIQPWELEFDEPVKRGCAISRIRPENLMCQTR